MFLTLDTIPVHLLYDRVPWFVYLLSLPIPSFSSSRFPSLNYSVLVIFSHQPLLPQHHFSFSSNSSLLHLFLFTTIFLPPSYLSFRLFNHYFLVNFLSSSISHLLPLLSFQSFHHSFLLSLPNWGIGHKTIVTTISDDNRCTRQI